MSLTSAHWELDQIEQTLRERFLERDVLVNPSYIVRYMGTSGEPGHRCLTFQIEVREELFTWDKKFLEQFVENLRTEGWNIDELRQPLRPGGSFDARLWLMVYEEQSTKIVAGGSPR